MAKQNRIIGRISYVKDWNNYGEHYVFEWKFDNDDEWNFECAAPLISFGEYKDMIHFTALTQIREWAKIGIKDIIWK